MPLSIPLPARAKIIINGAVIENSGTANITLTVHNKANILRDKDVITETEANTVGKQIYHAIQNAYLFEANKDEWLSVADQLLGKFGETRPHAAEIIAHVRELLDEDKIYNALRACRRLIALETEPGVETDGEAAEPQPKSSGTRSTLKATGAVRTNEIGKIKDQIAELERRIAALDNP